MKLDERDEPKRKRAKKELLKKWAILMLITIGMGILAFLLDMFLVNEVMDPLSKLVVINDNIRYYEDLSYTNAGYMDTTFFNEQIDMYTKIRRDEFYHSDDKIVATITQWPGLVKGFIFVLSFILVGALTAFPIVFLIVTLRYTYKRYKLKVEIKTKRRLRSGNYTAQKK